MLALLFYMLADLLLWTDDGTNVMMGTCGRVAAEQRLTLAYGVMEGYMAIWLA